jgi:hypothetical protein
VVTVVVGGGGLEEVRRDEREYLCPDRSHSALVLILVTTKCIIVS